MSDYATMKVGQLRTLCKSRGLSSDERKEDLISALLNYDASIELNVDVEQPRETATPPLDNQLTPEELKELATITDEMRHLRRQWLLLASRQNSSQTQGGQFVHQGYSANRR